MVQFFYKFHTTKVCVSERSSARYIKEIISLNEDLDTDSFFLMRGGRILASTDDVDDNCTIEVSLRLLGGKGGYGNELKKKAKIVNPNAVLDFSSCRDVNGRKMSFVNALVVLKKYNERLEQLEELKQTNPNATLLDIPVETPHAGIEGWYCGVPCWAEGVKHSRKAYQRQQKKQKMCTKWLEARKNGNVPPNAGKDWGCPLGNRCEFAHGIDELTGLGKAAYLEEQEQLKKKQELENIEKYINYEDMSSGAVDAVADALKTKKTAKKRNLSLAPMDDEFGFSLPPKKKAAKAPAKQTPTSVAPVTDSKIAGKLRVLTGNAQLEDNGVIIGVSSFPSVQLGQLSVVSGKYYFEVLLVTEGLVQIGWCGKENQCSEEESNGVGDCENSWGFDVARGKKWHGDDGCEYGEACQAGDVIGVLMDVDKQTLSFSRNGKELGVAFSNVSGIGGLFPALSLEKDECVMVNLGQNPFEYEPTIKTTSVWDYVKKLKLE